MTKRVTKILENITFVSKVNSILSKIDLNTIDFENKGGVGSGIYDHLKRGGEHYKQLPKVKREMEDYKGDIATPKSEIAAMKQYQHDGYAEINGKLRQGIPLGEKEGTVGKIDNYLTNAPKYEGTIYRGMRFSDDNDYEDFKKSISPGSILTDKGFMSTSTDADIMQDFESNKMDSVALEIDGKNGVYVAGTSSYKQENEVLFNRNTTIKIESVKEDSQKVTLFKGGKPVEATIKTLRIKAVEV